MFSDIEHSQVDSDTEQYHEVHIEDYLVVSDLWVSDVVSDVEQSHIGCDVEQSHVVSGSEQSHVVSVV